MKTPVKQRMVLSHGPVMTAQTEDLHDEISPSTEIHASLSLRALHIACARKISAERIYTWNVRHFQLVAPDLASRIITP